MTLRVRALSDEEREELGRMARSRSLGAGLVRRAQIIHACAGRPEGAGDRARMDLCGATVRLWLKRFNERGLEGLEEDVRSGRPPTYTAEERSAVIATALTRPAELGLPFASWTLDRLVAYLGEQGIAMRRSRISEILIREGLKWRQRGDLVRRAGRPGLRAQKGAIEQLYTAAPAGSVVVCLDEMGPQAAKSYPGRRLVKPAGPEARAGQAGDRLRPARQRATSSAPSGRRPGRPSPLTYERPHHRQLGRLPRRRSRPGSIPRSSGSTPCSTTSTSTAPPTCCCSPAAPALGVRVPAQVRGLPEPDRAVVEGAALAGPEGAPLRDLGRDRARPSNGPPPTGTSTSIPSSGAVRRRHRTARRSGRRRRAKCHS